jgi:hypothetical protein
MLVGDSLLTYLYMKRVTLSQRTVSALFFLLLILIGLPVVVFITQKRQDIRPKALTGSANLLLSADNTNPGVGQDVVVLVSMQLSDSRLRVSGADITIQYDKTKVSVTNITPATTANDASAAFTDATVVTQDQNVDSTFNSLRVAEVANKASNQLAGGTVQLMRITFRTLTAGSATIKFPDNKQGLEIVGVSL